MKLCIPSKGDGGLDDLVCEHLGRAPTFTVVDLESGDVHVVRNTSDHMGGTGKPPEHVARTGAEAVVCIGLGPRAIEMLQSLGIKAYVGASGTVENAVHLWRDGKLKPASYDVACREHHH